MQKFIKYFLAFGLIVGLGINISNISAASDIFNDGFENGFSNWTSPVGSKWSSSNTEYSGSKSARIKGDVDGSILKKTNISTSGYSNIGISFWYKADDSLESSDGIKAQYTIDGSTWATFFTIDNSNDKNSEQNNGWNKVNYSAPSGADNNSNFGIRFSAKLNSEKTDQVYIDEVKVFGDQANPRLLNITVNGDGNVVSSPEGITCGEDCDGTFDDGASVTLTPNAATGWSFTGFSGDCTGTEPCTLTMDANKSVQANFEEITTTIVMTKVVCTHESDLPNWGNGGPDVTSSTATDWVNSHPGCYLASDFNFEWAPYTESNPGDNVETGGANWTTFGPTINTGVTSTQVVGQEPLWVREKASHYYLGFSGALSGQDDMESEASQYSAELYCQNDVLNYDNYDYIESPTSSGVVHCVAFNYEIDSCPNIEGEQLGVPNGMHKVNGSCVPEVSTVNICKVDENQNPLPGWTVILKGESVQDNLNIPVADINGVDTNSLLSGISYLFESSGTWMNQWGLNPVDTEYSQVNNAGPWVDQYPGINGDVLELRIGGQAGFWGAYNSAHKYARSLIPGSEGSINLGIFDGENEIQNPVWFTDNENSTLSVDISKGYAGITGENGCTTFENVPMGTYIVDEIMQDGWENVSGRSVVNVDSSDEVFTIVNKLTQEEPPQQICTEKNMEVVSDGTETVGEFNSSILSFIHGAWSNITGASWIWNIDGVTDPTQDEFVTFNRSFAIPGNPLSAVLEVLADNSYTGEVNSFNSIGSEDENNFGQIDTYNLSAGDLVNGSNNISFTVKNLGVANSTPITNPAGLSYKLSVSYEECVTPDPEDDDEEEPQNTAPVIVLNGDSSVNLTVGDTYSEAGAIANDLEDGLGLVVTDITGSVDTNTPDTYNVTYNYTDTGGMSALAVTRTIIVTAAPDNENDPEDNPEDDNDNNDDDDTPEDNTPNNNQGGGGGGGFVPLSFLGSPQNNEPQGQVLGESTTCGIYLEKFLRKGYKNDVDSVKKVQTFLNNYMKSNLPITGFFGPLTDNAVKKFQWLHKDDILTPWGLKTPTGIVYLTTTKKINEIMCPELNLTNPELVPFENNPDSPVL